MKEAEALLPCPFCGCSSLSEYNYKAIHIVCQERNKTVYGLSVKPYKQYYVSCGSCGARTGPGITGPDTSEEQARQLAIDKWNRRSINGHE